MKRLLATTAVALVALSGAASAQSVLERVLGAVEQVNLDTANVSQLNGILANIAENTAILGGGTATYYTDDDVTITTAQYEALYQAALAEYVNGVLEDNDFEFSDPDGAGPLGAVWHSPEDYVSLGYFESEAAALEALAAYLADEFTWVEGLETWTEITVDLGAVSILNAIDGSITNLIQGLSVATAEAGGEAIVYDIPTIDIGDLSTTVLGAVNTGEITLGVNQDVAEAISGTTSAVSATISQLGGSADTGLLVLNVAHNATDVIARVTNTFEGVNGAIGDVATTALGAVNTGTITSGINAAVSGVQAGIIGPAAN